MKELHGAGLKISSEIFLSLNLQTLHIILESSKQIHQWLFEDFLKHLSQKDFEKQCMW